jgi:hypothetical protein
MSSHRKHAHTHTHTHAYRHHAVETGGQQETCTRSRKEGSTTGRRAQ